MLEIQTWKETSSYPYINDPSIRTEYDTYDTYPYPYICMDTLVCVSRVQTPIRMYDTESLHFS